MELNERKLTLREKLNDRWEKKPTVAVASTKLFDAAGLGFFFTTTVGLLANSLFITLPQLYSAAQTCKTILYIVHILIFGEIISNWIACRISSKRDDVTQIENVTNPQWRSCHICQRLAPPRSHHCKFCDKCVLKRDMHCFVTGQYSTICVQIILQQVT